MSHTFAFSIAAPLHCSEGAYDGSTPAQSEPGSLRNVLGVSVALDGDRGCGMVDVGDVNTRQVDVRRGEVLFETMPLRRPGDRHDPWPAGEQPCKGDLRRSRAPLNTEVAKQGDDGLIRAGGLRGEAWQSVAVVRVGGGGA